MITEIISKATGRVTEVSTDTIDLDAPSIVRLDLDRSQIAGLERQGHDLIVRLTTGEQIRIADFYPNGDATPNDLVLKEDNGSQWLAHAGSGSSRFSRIADLDELTQVAGHGGGGGSGLLVPALLGGLGAAGAAVGLAGGGGAGGSGARVLDSDTGAASGRTAPAAPLAVVRMDGGAVTGRGEPGATVQVRDAAGAVIASAPVGADGNYTVALSPPQANGQTLAVSQTNAGGNTSPALAVTAPDITSPPAPTAAVDATGTAVTGRGEPGATLVVRDEDGTIVGTGTVAADGRYTVTLTPAQADGGPLMIAQTDAAGNVSPATALLTPDLTAPAAPTASVSADGTAVTGTGEPGATVTVRAPDGTVLATAPVAADGRFTAPLTPAQANGGTISATQADAAGNVSAPTLATAPDVTAPAAPGVTVSADGGSVSGTGEPGATVTVRGSDGTILATAPVAPDGSFTTALTPAQVNGGNVSATQADPTGNTSLPTLASAPDSTAPAAPTLAVSGDGSSVTGTGEPGATVTVRAPDGTILATAPVTADGSFSAPLTPAQANGGSVSATQADAAGNTSPPALAAAPDITAPAAPALTVGADGGSVTGTGEPGATVTVRGPDGAILATAPVTADGSFTAAMAPALRNGEALSATQADVAGNSSAPSTANAPDLTAPAQPDATVAADGGAVTGTGEPAARIEVRDAAGTVIGTAVVEADGRFTAPLTPAQANGEALSATQVDAAGNASAPVPLVAPDLTAPPAPAAELDATGAVVTGTGEPGARVAVLGADGGELGSAVVSAQGSYAVTLATPQVDAQALAVTQSDAAGNTSPATPLLAPDLSAPAAPLAAVAGDGASIAGTGEPGATVTVRDPLGATVATATVGTDGSFAAPLTPAQVDGERLSVTQADPAGNVSAPAEAVAPDLIVDSDPDAPIAAVTDDGTAVTGTALANAAITVFDANGVALASGVADAGGGFSVTLPAPLLNGETVRVTQTEGDGDTSPPATAIAPDLTAPAAPTAALDASGAVVTGTGEPGATIIVTAADGTPLGTALVNPRGDYAATLTPAQSNGETLAVAQADAAGNVSDPIILTARDFTAPDAPIAAVTPDGSAVTGTGEPGATVTVRDAAGVVIATAPVAADGSFAAPLSPAQANGEVLNVSQADAAGNASPAVTAPAPDITAPDAPLFAVAPDGTAIAGTGEPGAAVTIRDAGGTALATTTVGDDGRFAATLAQPLTNGEPLSATQTDPAGNESAPGTASAPDLVIPAAPTAAVSDDGTSVTGTGEPGARVVVTDPAGAVIGTGLVAGDGSYTAPLTPPQVDGELLSATQTDPAGNVSPPVAAPAPDLTAPDAPAGTVSDDGATLTGTGEPGAAITITDPAGATIGTAQVGDDGGFVATLTPAQRDGEVLTIVQADGAGNISPPALATAPDLTAPAAPVATIDDAGTAVTGTGEPGATVTVTGGGAPLGSATVAPDGSFTVPLNPVQANGEPLVVVQVDDAGNPSAPLLLDAPDVTAPPAPTATVSDDGSAVTGLGEPGATVTITGPGGVLGSAPVGADGSYTVPLAPAQVDGALLGATQVDGAGNASPTAPAMAPDLTAPDLPVAAVSGDGAFVTGTGEPGATVTVTDPQGNPVGTATVGPDGRYAAPLTPVQTDGQVLGVVQADAAGNTSPSAQATAPDSSAPPVPTAAVTPDGGAVTGTGIAGATITVTDPAGGVIGTATVGDDNSYTASLTPAQRNGELLGVAQVDGAGNASPPIPAVAPDLTAPLAPTAEVGPDGSVVTGIGEPGARVTIVGDDGTPLGTAVAGATGAYLVTLSTPQLNGETVLATQADAAGNTSPPTPALAPDLTAPPAPTDLAVAGDGSTLTGAGEPGAAVEVRDAGALVVGRGAVGDDGRFAVPLVPAQDAGGTLSVTQVDGAGNRSDPAATPAPFDIDAVDNVAVANLDLVPAATPVTLGTANYLALVSLGVADLDAQVLGTPNVTFTVADGHSLDAVFTYDTLLDLGVASGYAVVVQRFDGTDWVAVNGPGEASLVDVSLLNGALTATDTFGPGEYRAFLTFQGTAGAGVLGTLAVTGTDRDFTDVAAVVAAPVAGNVIADAGPDGTADTVAPGTVVTSVTVGGVTYAVTGDATAIAGAWGTLLIDPDGDYRYTPAADAAGLGQTDLFTYTLLDPTDGELESATLAITIGSDDITAAPVAVDDSAIAGVTYANVEAIVPAATEFSFVTPGTVLIPRTGTGADGFTVAAGTTSDVTITAARGGSLALLPSYTITVADADGAVVASSTQTAVAGLPVLGTGVTFTIQDLPAGDYTYTVSSTNVAGTGYATTVSLGQTITYLDQFIVTGTTGAEGNLLDNDTAGTDFAAIRVDTGAGFTEVGDTPLTIIGDHGTLTVNETGGYTYQPNATLPYSATDLVDSFTYQLVQPDGTSSTATLTVTVDVPADGVAAPDATLAFALFEGRGELEDVLGAYLAAREQPDGGVAPAPAEGPIDIAAVPVSDPFHYLAIEPEQDRHGTTLNPVV